MLEQAWWMFPLIAVPMSYLFYLAPNEGRWWLLFRINIAAIIGLTASLVSITEGIDYHDSRNSGVFAGFALGLALGLFLLAVADFITAIRLVLSRRALTRAGISPGRL